MIHAQKAKVNQNIIFPIPLLCLPVCSIFEPPPIRFHHSFAYEMPRTIYQTIKLVKKKVDHKIIKNLTDFYRVC
jgi:hypothetical protein